MPRPSRTQDEQAALDRLALNIKAARGQANLTQETLGHEAGLDQTEIAHLEAGRRNPGVLTLARLAKALGVTAADLMHGLP